MIHWLDSDAIKFNAACRADGVTLTSTQFNAINLLVKELKQNEIWNSMKAIYPFVGSSAASHKFNLKDPRNLDAAFRLTFVNSPTHSSNGVDWNGTNQYANTYLNPSSHLVASSEHLSYYTRTNNVNTTTDVEMGSLNGSNLSHLLLRRLTSNNYGVTIGTVTAISTTTDCRGLTTGSRTSQTSLKLYKNGLSISSNTTSDFTRVNAVIYIGARNDNGTPAGLTTKQCSFASIGTGLTDVQCAALYSTVQRFQTILGRQV